MTEQLCDAHYEGHSDNGTRIRVTLFRVTPPVKDRLTSEDGTFWQGVNELRLVAAHPARHDDEDDDDTEACFPHDPEYDDDGD